MASKTAFSSHKSIISELRVYFFSRIRPRAYASRADHSTRATVNQAEQTNLPNEQAPFTMESHDLSMAYHAGADRYTIITRKYLFTSHPFFGELYVSPVNTVLLRSSRTFRP